MILPAFVFAFSAQAFAADFTVNFTTDFHDANITDGVCDTNISTPELDCTLRAAIEQANNSGSNDRILFNLPANSAVVLNSAIGGEIPITNNGSLEIIGTGANNLTIDGGASDNRIFYVNEATAVISGMTLTGGNGTGSNASGVGGAIFANNSSLTLDSVHVTANTASKNSGGGAWFLTGATRIINSTFSANTARDCAGFENVGSLLTIINSTISSNTAANSGGGFCNQGSATLRNVTLTNNIALSGGGVNHFSGSLNLSNTIVAGNVTSNGPGPEIHFNSPSNNGTITSMGGNLIGDSPGDSTNTSRNITYQPTDIRDVNPRLGALVNNGGTTPTHAVFANSPLIDKGINALAADPSSGNAPLVFDPRGAGFARIMDGDGDGSAVVDIGAFERRIFGDPRPTSGDFDGDGKADIAVFRRSNGFWYVMKSTGGFSAVQWGLGTDYLVPGDYDGDGKTDVAVYRVGPPTVNITDNAWHIRRSSDDIFLTIQYGLNRGGYGLDIPVPADYDGDGKTDLGLFELSDAIGAPFDFKVWQSSDGTRYEKRFGANRDRLVLRDYDGDGKADLATARIEPSFSNNGIAAWQILQSSNGATKEVQFGLGTDTFIPRDYDGDGKTDIAVYRPSNGTWYLLQSTAGFSAIQFGLPTDITVPADYDGDGKTDIAVFRPSNETWYLLQSKDGFAAYVFGLADDVPVTALAR